MTPAPPHTRQNCEQNPNKIWPQVLQNKANSTVLQPYFVHIFCLVCGCWGCKTILHKYWQKVNLGFPKSQLAASQKGSPEWCLPVFLKMKRKNALRGRTPQRGVLGTFWKSPSQNPFWEPFSEPFFTVKPTVGPLLRTLLRTPSPEPFPEPSQNPSWYDPLGVYPKISDSHKWEGWVLD